MLRNLRLLRRLCLLKQAAAPPAILDRPAAATWWRGYTQHTTSEVTSGVTSDVTSHTPGGAQGSNHRQSELAKAKSTGKRKVLHSRVLSEEEKQDATQRQAQIQHQPEDDLFGLQTKGRVSSQRRQRQKKISKQKRDNLGPDKRHFPEKTQLELSNAAPDLVLERDGPEDMADCFGTMADPADLQLTGELLSPERADESDGEDKDHVPLRERGRSGHGALWYARQIEKLGREGKVYEAIEMLEKTMIQEDRVTPNEHVFTAVIGICGRAGYTKKAFSLFNKMKKYGILPDMPTYTALFNACANSPWREDGLTRANRLLRQLTEKDVQPNATALRAVVKAYGRLGELQTAFGLVDQMLEGGNARDPELWSHLLMACISDKDAGLNHAIEVWRLMRTKKVPFCLNHYNQLLRAARDCGVGGEDYANRLLTRSVAKSSPAHQQQEVTTAKTSPPSPPGGSDGEQRKPWWEDDVLPSTQAIDEFAPDMSSVEKTSKTTQITMVTSEKRTDVVRSISALDAQVPNILNPRGRWRRDGVTDVVALGDLRSSQSRLALLGGLPGVLSHMERDKVRPDIRTFAQLLDMAPADDTAEQDVLVAMRVHDVTPDADLLNQIIRRRCQRRRLDAALEMIPLFNEMELVPNLMTYASLALGCYTYISGLKLLDDMKTVGFEPTTDIFGILVRRSGQDFRYKMALCRRMASLGLPPSANIVKCLEESVSTARKYIVKRERGEDVPPHFRRDKFPEEFKTFMLFYKPWLLKSSLEKELHPWAGFRQPSGGQTPAIQEESNR